MPQRTPAPQGQAVTALAILTALVVVAVGIANLVAGVARRRENKVLARTPLAAIERSGEVHRIASRATRELERLLDDDMVRVTIPAPTQQRIADVIRQFNEL